MSKRLIARTLLAAAAALVLWGCSTAAPQAPPLNSTTGQHAANWVQTHWSEYLKNSESCKPCHGSTTDKTAPAGTSGVSCFGCHHPEGPNHPVGWAAFNQHGYAAQAAADATPFSMKGMASCTPCHGTDYKGKGIAVSCYSCHTRSPHASSPWGATATPPNPALASSHDRTDESNAAACFQCHAAVPGAVPGCTNNSMCHGKDPFTSSAAASASLRSTHG